MSTVLIVDDNSNVRTAIRAQFERHSGFVVCGEAEDGAEAIVKAGELKPDLIILDLSMPVMNGFEAAKILRKMLPSVPLFLLTAHYGKVTEQAALDVGIRAVFAKHEDLRALIAHARVVLAAGAAQGQA